MQFFVLENIVGSEAETNYDPTDERILGEAPRCPRCDKYIGLKEWLPPYRATLDVYGSRIGDIAFATGYNFLISETFLEAWRSHNLRGIDQAQPVEILGVQPKRFETGIQKYFHIASQQSQTAIDLERSKLIRDEMPTCDYCYEAGVDAILGFNIAEQTWTGEDIFKPRGLGVTVVTERVVEMAEESKLNNVTTIPVDDYRWDPLRKAEGN